MIMKISKIVIIMLLSLVSITGNAQHLQFMGVSMGGDIRSFTQSLTSKGMTKLYSGTHPEEEWVTMSGDFWMFENVDLLIQAPYADSGTTFVNVSSIRATKSIYTNLISSLDKKYGKHIVKVNQQYSGDQTCIWKTSKGNIEVWRSKYSSDDSKCNVEINYIDYPKVKREKTSANVKVKARANDL